MTRTTGISATGKENVLILAGGCSVAVLPAFGGKISSIKFRDQELLQAPLAPIAQRTRTMSFDASDASGWDECLPSVAACQVQTGSGSAQVPDHGDLWRVSWTVLEHTAHSVTLAGACFSLPLTLKRKLSLAETEKGVRLSLDYRVTNTGTGPVPWSWAAHPLFTAALGDRIVLPGIVHTLRLEGSGGNRLGTTGDEIQWPITELRDGSHIDLSAVEAPDSAIGDKLFAGPMHPDAAWCALERPSAGVRIKVSFDADATPYLGLWICYGGWPERPGPKQVCVALEPATAPVDSLALPGPWNRTLAPAAWSDWSMQVDLEPL
jgi:galactose mutarotase-like enzyme